MFDIITFGSATRDIFVRSKDFKIIKSSDFATGKALAVNAGSKVYVEELIFASGGGGTNTAVTFAAQGLKTAYAGLVGHDLSGKEIIKELAELGVECDLVKITNKAATPVSIILSAPGDNERSAFAPPSRNASDEQGKATADAPFSISAKGGEKMGERSILVYEGASHLLTEKDVLWDKIKASKWFYVSGLSGKSSKVFFKIIDFAKENGIKIAANPGHDQLTKDLGLLKSLLNEIDILIVNQEEAGIITGIDYQKEEEIFKKFDEIVDGIAVMSKGPEGVTVSDGKNIYRAGIPESGYVDRTGSGDAFGSGFVSAIIRGESIENAIQLGTANATSVVQKIGAKNGILKKGEWGEWERVVVEKSPIKS
jgi:ribokinase